MTNDNENCEDCNGDCDTCSSYVDYDAVNEPEWCDECDNAMEDCACEDESDICELCGNDIDTCICDVIELDHIDYQIGQNECTVAFQILRQEGLRDYKSLELFNDMYVTAQDYPNLEEHRISLRGKMTFNDDHIAKLSFDTEDEATNYYNKAMEALDEWDNSVTNKNKVINTVIAQPALNEEPTVQPIVMNKKDLMDKINVASNLTYKPRETKVTRTPTGGLTFS